jgi:hypothetical protein
MLLTRIILVGVIVDTRFVKHRFKIDTFFFASIRSPVIRNMTDDFPLFASQS